MDLEKAQGWVVVSMLLLVLGMVIAFLFLYPPFHPILCILFIIIAGLLFVVLFCVLDVTLDFKISDWIERKNE